MCNHPVGKEKKRDGGQKPKPKARRGGESVFWSDDEIGEGDDVGACVCDVRSRILASSLTAAGRCRRSIVFRPLGRYSRQQAPGE